MDAIVDHAVSVLTATPRIAVPLAELAGRLDFGDADALGRLLDSDPRILLLEPPALPGLGLMVAEERAAYDGVLRSVGFRRARRVALVHRTPAPGADLAALLRCTAARLLLLGAEPGVIDPAERANSALMAARAAVA